MDANKAIRLIQLLITDRFKFLHTLLSDTSKTLFMSGQADHPPARCR